MNEQDTKALNLVDDVKMARWSSSMDGGGMAAIFSRVMLRATSPLNSEQERTATLANALKPFRRRQVTSTEKEDSPLVAVEYDVHCMRIWLEKDLVTILQTNPYASQHKRVLCESRELLTVAHGVLCCL